MMKSRPIKLLCLLGFAPEIWLLESKTAHKQEPPHIRFGVFLNLVFLFSLAFFPVIQVLEYYLEPFLSDWASATSQPIEDVIDVVSLMPLFLWGVLLIVGLLSLINFPLTLHIIARPFRNSSPAKLLVVVAIVPQLVVLLAVGVCFRANYLARHHPEVPSVYMLYENAHYMGGKAYQVPDWIFALGFYPIAETAASRWGDTSIAIEPLSKESLSRALQNGRMIFIASHGGYPAGTIALSPNLNDNFHPADINQLGGVGANLQFVYIAGCMAGRLKNDWQQALAPAKLIIFDRTSWYVEHIYWLWFVGPAVVAELK